MTDVRNQRRSIRITVLLITAIASLVTLSTGIVLVLSGMAAFRSTFELLSDTATLTMEAVETEVRSHVIPARQIVSHITTLVESGDIDPANQQQMVTAMKGAMAAAPQIAGLVYWNSENIELRVGRLPDGTVAAALAQEITDPYILASIARVKTTGTPSWGPPVFNDGATYVYVLGPLVHTGSFLGVLTSGVTISELSSKVDRIGRHLDITAFVLFGNDHVLAHPELIGTTGNNAFISEQNPLLPITELKDAVLRRFHHAEPHRDHQIENVTVRNIHANGQEYLAMSRSLTEFGGTPWHIGIYATMDSLDDQVRRLVGAMIAGLGVLGLAIVGAIVLARYIARPIRNIASVADRVGRFELTDITAVPRSRIKELDEQSVAFNRMLDGLRWFETYVPKSLVHRLIAGQDGQSVPSGEQEVTVMFTDIIGFTAMTEHMAPADVATMLNRQFEVINQCIEAEGGTLDKYIGDSVMAFWGAPEHQPDHAERACRAALHIARAVAEDTTDGIKHPPIRLKIAVHTGRLLVGNIGAKARMNYTVIGDTVNTCSRIETLCGEFDTGDGSIILVSGDTMAQAQAGTGLVFEDAGSFTVKGRQEPVHVSKLTGAPNVTL